MHDSAAAIKRPLRVTIVEDEPLFRDLLRIALEQHHDFEVVASYENGDEAAKGLLDVRPDVALFDIQIPGRLNGFEVGLLVRQRLPETGVVILSNHREPAFLTALRRKRLTGWSYLLKQTVSRPRFQRIWKSKNLHRAWPGIGGLELFHLRVDPKYGLTIDCSCA